MIMAAKMKEDEEDGSVDAFFMQARRRFDTVTRGVVRAQSLFRAFSATSELPATACGCADGAAGGPAHSPTPRTTLAYNDP